ncbi:chromosome partitioning protein ParB [Pseudomonas aeruginosa HB15]|nr:chromosome partitioning protein ParB [Pseudomonas aeruginosa HB15]
MVAMSGKRIGIGARPLADPQAEAWIRQGAALDSGKAERYSARLTLDVTPALRTRIKLAAFDRGVTMAEMLREVLEQQFPEATS